MAWFYLIIAGVFECGWAIGTAYAVWTGIGAVTVTILGIILFNEPRNLARVICIFLIVIGVIGLKIFSKTALS